MRIQKADVGSQVPNSNNITPQLTSETPLVSSSASNNIISQDNKTVNKNSVSVGDTFRDTKFNNTITVVERDDTNTVVEIDNGKTVERKVLENAKADTLILRNQYEQIGNSESLSSKDTMVPVQNATTDFEKVVVDYVETEISNVEYDLKKVDKIKNIFAGTRSGYVRVLSDGTYESGTYGEGSGGFVANENIVRSNSLEEVLSAQYKYMLENSNGDISHTIQKHLKNYKKRHNESAPVSTEYTTVNEDVIDLAEGEIKPVVDAINETLLPGAKENIFVSMEKVGQKGDIAIFAKRMVEFYAEKGTIGSLADYFSDSGEKVVATIENIAKDIKGLIEKNSYFQSKKHNKKGDATVNNVNTDPVGNDGKNFLAKLQESANIFNNTPKIFSINTESIKKKGKMTESIEAYFKDIGGKVVNPVLGIVELNKKGAKTTVFHGMSGEKFTAVAAIKDVIEKGFIISHDTNWKNRGYDTYLIAGKGDINGDTSVVGVIVKNYPNSKHNNKFYLHEVIKIGASHTAVDNNSTHVNEQTPINNNIISQENNVVNNSVRTNTENDTKTAKVIKAIKNSLRPEIISNPKIMSMLQERFGENGFAEFASDIILTYSQNGSIGEHEALFTDGGKAVYDALAENIDTKFSVNVLNDETNSDIINDDNVIETSYSTDENDLTLYLPRQEYAMVSKAIMKKNAGVADKKLKPVDYVYAADGFYVYRNNSFGDFTVTEKFDVETEYERISVLEELIDDGIYTNTDRERLNRLLDDVQSGEGSNTGDNERTENRRTAVGNDRVFGGQQRSDTIRHSSGVSENNSSDEVSYSVEREGNDSGQAGDLLSNGSSEWQNGKRPRQPTKRVDGRSRRYKEGKGIANERREYCKTLKDAGNTIRKVIFGHQCEVIGKEHYTKRMANIEKRNAKNGIDETIFITGKAKLPFLKDKNGNSKTAKGIFIKTKDGRKIVIVQYDHDLFTPEQINDHELVHKDFKSNRVQKVKNLIINSLSVVEKKDILERLARDYNGIIKNNEEKIFEEFVANTLSGMNEYTSQFDELVKAYWAEDDALIDTFKVSEYVESTDSGGGKNDYNMDVFPTYSEKYTEDDYTDFGWARANGILNAGQNSDYRSKFMAAKNGHAKFNMTNSGEYIIPVSDIYDASKEGINNTLVFANGTIDKPVITSIIRIYEDNETILDIVRRYIYDCERRGIQPEVRGSFRRYYAVDFKSSKEQQEEILSGTEYSEDNSYRGENRQETERSGEIIEPITAFDIDNRRPNSSGKSIGDTPSNEINKLLGVDDISYSNVTNTTKIKYNPSGLKLTATEREKVYSAISTDYYNKNKTHEGLQYQSCVTDNEHILYIYEDGGFGYYNVVAKVDYANEDVATAIMGVINNEKIDTISNLINRVTEILEDRRSGYSIYNAYTKKIRRGGRNASLHKGPSSRDKSGRFDANSSRDRGAGRGNESARERISDFGEGSPYDENISNVSYSLAGENTEFWDEWLDKIKEYGAIPVGENPHREIQVPKRTAKDKKVSQTVRTILEAKATPDEAVPTIEKMVEDGIFSY